jgi:hypothetical protein
LILAPLAVSAQFVREGAKFGVEVTPCRENTDIHPGINVINYERLHKIDTERFGGVVLDESSILKSYEGKTRTAILDAFARTPFKLACSATPAPNDHMELGNHSEFVGAMSRTEMLATFFCHDGGETQKWRLKRHALHDWWRWLCSWAVTIRMPSDLGYDDEGFRLPELRMHDHVVSAGAKYAQELGLLFADQAAGLNAQRAARRASMDARVQKAASIVNAEPDESWLVWCELNDESVALTAAIQDAVEVTGSMDADEKEACLEDFGTGDLRVMVSKSSIAGWGMNYQNCARVVFVGLSNSFESWYQAVRRVWRFGQRRPVECHIVTCDADGAVRSNLERKRLEWEQTSHEMLVGMGDIQRAEIGALARNEEHYRPGIRMRLPAGLRSEAGE